MVAVFLYWKALALAALPGCGSAVLCPLSLRVSCIQHGRVQGHLCALARGVHHPASSRSLRRLYSAVCVEPECLWLIGPRGFSVPPLPSRLCRRFPKFGSLAAGAARPLPAAAGTTASPGPALNGCAFPSAFQGDPN